MGGAEVTGVARRCTTRQRWRGDGANMWSSSRIQLRSLLLAALLNSGSVARGLCHIGCGWRQHRRLRQFVRTKAAKKTSCIHCVALGGQKDYLRYVRDIFINQTKARFVYLHIYLTFSSICLVADRLTFCRIDQLATESRTFFFLKWSC
jgi:hypothetical protein